MIPILSIQPLVENAVKHGISGKSGGGRVSLKAETDSGGLRVTVEDTGIGFERSSSNHQGGASVGLENVRRRLLLCHGPEADLHIQSSSSGSKVTFFLPNSSRAEPAAVQSAVEI
jgi:sensor histidine kinase YesM